MLASDIQSNDLQKWTLRLLFFLNFLAFAVAESVHADEQNKNQKSEATVIQNCKDIVKIPRLGLANHYRFQSLPKTAALPISDILKEAGYNTHFLPVARPNMPNIEDRKIWFLIEKLYANEARIAASKSQSLANTKFLEKRMIEGASQTVASQSEIVRDIRSGRWGTPEEMWALVGLGNAYKNRFKSDEFFFNSRLTLKEIYVQLYKSQVKRNLYGLLLASHIGERKDFDADIVGSKPGQIAPGQFIALTELEIREHVPEGILLWNARGEHRVAGVENKEIEFDRVWGIRPSEDLGTLDQPAPTISLEWPLAFSEDQELALLLASKAVDINRPYSTQVEADLAAAYLKYMMVTLVRTRQVELNMPDSTTNPFLMEFKKDPTRMFEKLGLSQEYSAWRAHHTNPEWSWVQVFKALRKIEIEKT